MCFKTVSRSFEGDSRKFQRSLEGVINEQMMFQECFKEVSILFKEILQMCPVFQCNFKDVSKKLEWHFRSVLKGFEKLVSEVFQASFRVVSGNIQGCVKSISKIPPGAQKCLQL